MSNPGDADATPLTSVRQMAEYLAAGCKPSARFRIGTEHEKFGFRHTDLSPPPYLPADGQPGSIRDLLGGLARFGGERILDGENTIGLKQDGASVSLEPAGQLELSGAPVETLHETQAELEAHFDQVRAVCRTLDMGFAPLGFHPLKTRAEMPWMPKGRYAIMRRYMPTVGNLGLDMMTRTCTVQVNLDFESEADMRRKIRVSLLLQSLATALFANSPFTEGKPNGFLSYRAHVWTDTDNQRSGIPPVMLEDGFGFERHAQWLIEHVPMYFVYRDGGYIDVAGKSFADFMAGRVPELAGVTATLGDFADHVTTAFTDVRLKRYLEMRGADAGRADMMVAQSALWVGLLYDPAALAAAEALLRDATWDDAVTARSAVPRQGLAAPWRGGTLRDILPDVLAIARDGLRARARRNAAGEDETIYLDPLREIAAGGPTQAEYWLGRLQKAWGGDVRRIFHEAAI
ncbi:MAG TPA: glutamate--cysteine ligase [Rhodopila sp.]|uniref:glutamate--cysteine ligase n=1 Tax=Rhodopila sp. TaxID=2480087 RepID=UPI002CD75721|nr:glutamate--cysteine ligase [Rhodopila sp.]HVY17287.1 glutamate--cysteine ligase [Rhodopila sp.]